MRRLVLLFPIALTHLPLLFMDGLYWDDWILSQFIRDGNYQGHALLWKELGLPGYAPIYWTIGSLTKNPAIAHNILTFALILAIATLVEQLARTAGKCAPFESGIVAIVAGIYPALETTFAFNVTVYILMLTLFLAGANVALAGQRAQGTRKILTRLCALTLFTISFQHSSLLVFYGGFLLLLWFTAFMRTHSLLRTIAASADFLLLPIAFWIVTTTFFPRIAYYNAFTFDLRTIVIGGAFAFMSKGLMEQGREIIHEVLRFPLLWAGSVATGVGIWWTMRKKMTSLLSRNSSWSIGVYGGILLFLSILPYILVSKTPRAHGFTTRHALLLSIPVGVLLLATIRPVLQRKWASFIAVFLLGTMIMGSTFALWENYVQWQARWVKDRSLITYFEDHPELRRVTTFTMDDRFPLNAERYRFYEWSSMMRHAWGETGRIGLLPDERFEKIAAIEAYHPFWREWHQLAGYPRSACSATLRIEKRSPLGNGTLAWTYLKHRFLTTEGDMRTFLRGVTTITVEHDRKTCRT